MAEDINNVILTFAQQRPSWQQDLFRRVLTQDSVTSVDLQEVLLLLKSAEGIESASALQPVPLSSDHVRFHEQDNSRTILLSISAIQNVNQLVANQELPFASGGITLIYGDNGSGKSGYCRILRQLCRARLERRERVLGDVYATSPQVPTQATLCYSVGGDAKDHLWEDGNPPPKELSRLTVFDAQTAPIYVDKQNQIEFLPEGLDILPKVGSALHQLGEMLDHEIDALTDQIRQPAFSVNAETSVGALLRRLEPTNVITLPSLAEIEQAGQWSEELDRTLANVREALATISQPSKAAAKCRRIKVSLEKVARVLHDATARLADQAILNIRLLKEEARTAQEVAKTTASETFRDDPFGAYVGTDVWRNLFRYAREFSDLVYPGRPFPVTGINKQCVLCQQTLSQAASDRFARFHSFLEHAAFRDAEERERDLVTKLLAFNQLRIPDESELNSDLGEYAALGPETQAVVSLVATLCEALKKRKESCDRQAAGETHEAFAALPLFNIESLSQAGLALEAEAVGYDRMLKDESRRHDLESKQAEMEAQQRLSSERPHILERQKLIEKIQKLRKCRTACDSTAVSRKASILREEHLSGGFQKRLFAETKRLGVSYLPLKVASKSERGASFLGIALEQNAGARTASVLSEGEFRVLALACFLAEVGGINGHDGIVIDDPVSSLDHRHIRQVARRLVEEATARPQVIMFTHSLPFYHEVIEAAQESRVSVETHWLQRTGTRACGKVSANDSPWQVKKVKERLVNLEEILRCIQLPEDCLEADYIRQVKSFYGPLRETWERLVEERLLNGVVSRFEVGVKTQSLRGVTVEDSDYHRVFGAMVKASRYSGHDGAVSFQTSLPNRSELRQDLDLIRSYEQELRKRMTSVETRRKALEDPVKVMTA